MTGQQQIQQFKMVAGCAGGGNMGSQTSINFSNRSGGHLQNTNSFIRFGMSATPRMASQLQQQQLQQQQIQQQQQQQQQQQIQQQQKDQLQ